MGCSQSKIENEEAVSRCKGRKRHLKEAVAARNAFAAAHSGFAMALKNTGAALSDYAPGESYHKQPPFIAPTSDGVFRPPPRPDFDTTSSLTPLSRATSMPEISLPKGDHFSTADPILEEGEEDGDIDGISVGKSLRISRGRPGIKPSRAPSEQDIADEDGPRPPPTPPPQVDRMTMPVQSPFPDMRMSSNDSSSWDFFTVDELDRMRWEATGGNSLDERFTENEKPTRPKTPETPKAPVVQTVEKVYEPSPSPASASVVPFPIPGAVNKGMQKMKGGSSVNMLTIFNELDDHFLKASESAHNVSVMMEANRLHYHSNFADNRGHIDHSARVMRVITWNRSFKGLSKEEDIVDDFDSDDHETHATVLDKLLAWEKKLYDEVKAIELMKFEYQKKVGSLNRQKKRGTNSDTLEKSKAAVSHLHTRYVVDMQALDSTVSEIERLRDKQLYPKLTELADGLATMWGTIREHHEQQEKIARALEHIDLSSVAQKETSDHHHHCTIQLWDVVQEWHSQLQKLLTHQKHYIKSLNQWLRLNLIPIESSLKEKVSSPKQPKSPPILSILQAWQKYLDNPIDGAVTSAVFGFAAVIHTIVQQQEEEAKLRARREEARKEFGKKRRGFEEWRKKEGLSEEEIREREEAVEGARKRVEEAEEMYKQQCVVVRDKSLMTLRSSLPNLFRKLSDFAGGYSNIYRELRSISKVPVHDSS